MLVEDGGFTGNGYNTGGIVGYGSFDGYEGFGGD